MPTGSISSRAMSKPAYQSDSGAGGGEANCARAASGTSPKCRMPRVTAAYGSNADLWQPRLQDASDPDFGNWAESMAFGKPQLVDAGLSLPFLRVRMRKSFLQHYRHKADLCTQVRLRLLCMREPTCRGPSRLGRP
jgi:hypothetical protein